MLVMYTKHPFFALFIPLILYQAPFACYRNLEESNLNICAIAPRPRRRESLRNRTTCGIRLR